METIDLHPGWRNAVAVFLRENKTYGDILEFKWLYDAFCVPMPKDDSTFDVAKAAQLAFLGQLEKFRSELLVEHQMALVSERGVGYRVLLPEEQTDFAEKEGRHNLRKALRRQGELLTNVNLAVLSARERQENADALARLSNIRAKTKEIYPPRLEAIEPPGDESA